jgi:hypothetical protein
MTKFIVKHATDEGEFETICEREYSDDVRIPEQGQLLEIPGEEDDEDEFVEYFVENVGQRMHEEAPDYLVVVRDAEQVRRQIKQRRRKEMQRMKQMQQQQRGGGGGGGQGGGSPFSLK